MQAQKVLIIDDSATSCALMERALQTAGYQALIATDGREGLTMALQEQPHCIILDVVLPGMNGFEVCRHLRNSTDMRGVPIIMVSTKNTSLDKSWAMRQGATQYLVKPFKPEEFVDRVKEVLLRHVSQESTVPPPSHLPPFESLPPLEPLSPVSPRHRQASRPAHDPPSIEPLSPSSAQPRQTGPIRPVNPFNAAPPERSRMPSDADQPFSGKVPAYQQQQQSPPPPTVQSSSERTERYPVNKLVPQRPEGADRLWGSSPHLLFSADQATRTLYESIDGRRNIEQLCLAVRMVPEDVIKILRSLLIQHRIQICDPTGKVLHSAVLFSERL